VKPLGAWFRAGALTLALMPLLGASNTFAPPVVVVYPLTVSGGAEPEAGANIAVVIANRMATIAGISVKTYPPGTQRADFLTVARSLGADYYITGFLTPLGDQVTLVTQVVSTASGSVVSSSTALVRTYADATAQADLLGESIIHHAGRALASLDRPISTPAPKPEEKTENNIGGLFKRKKKSTPAATATPTSNATGVAVAVATPATPARTPTPTPTAKPTAAPRTVAARNTPTPQPPRPTRPPTAAPTTAPTAAPTAQQVAAAGTLARAKLAASALVLDAAGDAPPDAAGYAQDAIVTAFARSGTTVAAVPVGAGAAVSRARELCASTFGARTVYAPTLSLDRNKNGDVTGVTLDIDAYDCGGNPAGRQTGRSRITGRGINGALDNAATTAVTAFLFANQR